MVTYVLKSIFLAQEGELSEVFEVSSLIVWVAIVVMPEMDAC